MNHFSKTALLTGILVYGFSATGAVTGKIEFKGKAPKMAAIKMNADPVCMKAHATPFLAQDVVVNSNNTLANVFVFVKEGVKNAPTTPPAAVTFDQNGCVYHPHVMGLQVNQTFKILNSDPTLHNVHAMPKVNTGFNMGMATKGQSIEKKFTKPEQMVKVKCDVHGWMNAWIGVVEHPFFAVSDTTGAYKIENLPAGEYTLSAWHEKFGTQTAKLTVGADGTAKPVDFTFTDKAVN